MTTVRLALLPLIMVAGLVSVASADVSGKWKLNLTADWTTIPELTCTLSQKGQELSGSCGEAASDGRRADVIAGKIDDGTVSWQMKGSTPDGETFTYSLTGTVDAKGTTMKGSFKVSTRFSTGQGSFSATKQ